MTKRRILRLDNAAGWCGIGGSVGVAWEYWRGFGDKTGGAARRNRWVWRDCRRRRPRECAAGLAGGLGGLTRRSRQHWSRRLVQLFEWRSRLFCGCGCDCGCAIVVVPPSLLIVLVVSSDSQPAVLCGLDAPKEVVITFHCESALTTWPIGIGDPSTVAG